MSGNPSVETERWDCTNLGKKIYLYLQAEKKKEIVYKLGEIYPYRTAVETLNLKILYQT